MTTIDHLKNQLAGTSDPILRRLIVRQIQAEERAMDSCGHVGGDAAGRKSRDTRGHPLSEDTDSDPD